MVKLVEHHVHGPEVGGIGVHQNRLAGDRHGVRDTLRACRPTSSTLCITFCVRSSDDESGSWTFTSRYPLSCAGMKPVGVRVNAPVRQPEQAAVDDQHQHAHPQQAPDHPGVNAVDASNPLLKR